MNFCLARKIKGYSLHTTRIKGWFCKWQRRKGSSALVSRKEKDCCVNDALGKGLDHVWCGEEKPLYIHHGRKGVVAQGRKDSLKARRKKKKRRGTTVVQLWLKDKVSHGRIKERKKWLYSWVKKHSLFYNPAPNFFRQNSTVPLSSLKEYTIFTNTLSDNWLMVSQRDTLSYWPQLPYTKSWLSLRFFFFLISLSL